MFAPHHLNQTIDQIMTAQHAEADTTAAASATARIADANRKMTRYRAARSRRVLNNVPGKGESRRLPSPEHFAPVNTH